MRFSIRERCSKPRRLARAWAGSFSLKIRGFPVRPWPCYTKVLMLIFWSLFLTDTTLCAEAWPDASRIPSWASRPRGEGEQRRARPWKVPTPRLVPKTASGSPLGSSRVHPGDDQGTMCGGGRTGGGQSGPAHWWPPPGMVRETQPCHGQRGAGR